MNAHFLLHVDFEGPGRIGTWLRDRGATTSGTRFFSGERPPDPEDLDFIALMGGPMSANDEDRHPWLKTEKGFIRAAAARGVPLLGVCLGAQLIASAMGARVYVNPVKEIGWLPVKGVPASSRCFRFPNETIVFQWHGETFDLPVGAERLAASPDCENQAFQIGRGIIGLQFHLEATPEGARALIENCGDDLIPGPRVQSAKQIEETDPRRYSEAHSLMAEVLEFLLGGS
jgi:GMP synthase-like glutamine amidotransferase